MKFFVICFFIIASQFCRAQDSLKIVLDNYNDHSVPYIMVDNLAKEKGNDIVLIDAREINEYEVSHIDKAIFVGFEKFNIKSVLRNIKNKNKKIVVYCSLGIRSEIVAKKIIAAGYKNVHNLYGGIFEWSNFNFPLINSKGIKTKRVHTFNKAWSKWLVKGKGVYEK